MRQSAAADYAIYLYIRERYSKRAAAKMAGVARTTLQRALKRRALHNKGRK